MGLIRRAGYDGPVIGAAWRAFGPYNVEDNPDVPAHRHFAFNGIEKTDELLTGKRGSEAL